MAVNPAATSHRIPWLQRVLLVAFDAGATFVSYLIAAWGTAEWSSTASDMGTFGALAVLAVLNVVVYVLFGMYSVLWRYASISECLRIVAATIAAAVVSDSVFTFVFGSALTPRTFVLAWAVLTVLCGGVRLGIRAVAGNQGWRFGTTREAPLPRTLIVGAGEAGSLTVKRMLSGDPDMPGNPVAVVDDDRSKVGMKLHGVKIAGRCSQIPAIAEASNAQQIVMAIPSASREQRQYIYERCMETGLKVYTLPRLQDISKTGRLPLRDVDISDLLSRDEIKLDVSLVSSYVTGKTILVTGGGGSIGSELVRQLLPARPARIVLFDVYENTVYELCNEIGSAAREAGIDLRAEIGSITHLPALERVFRLYKPDVVFHAAAHKHVPLMEADPREAIENNVFGTLNVCRMADKNGCSHFILISTDKAVNPTNVMGATKRMCEMIVQYYASVSETVFAAVRFGNVLGSHGSVIPLFKRQLEHGGPITVTHRDIIRYFMTIPEASRLVITAGALAKGGEIFILNMGEPVKIWNLAENLVRLSGLEPGRDIDIIETGLRPGEKMYEELLMGEDKPVPTDVADITVSRAAPPDLGTVQAKLDELEGALDGSDEDIKLALAGAVPTYTPEVDD